MLAFDTATPVVTVALHDGTRVLSGETADGARRHGELLAAMIERVLAAGGVGRTDLEAIAVGTGPGPYTGLRAGVVTARVLASALRIPAVGVCTLDVMARAAVPAAAGREFIVAADARRKEVYWARYGPAAQRIGHLAVGPPAAIASAASCPVAGEGRCSTPSCSPARFRRAIRTRRVSRRSRRGGWRSMIRSRPPSRCTCAGPTPASPGRPSGSRQERRHERAGRLW